MAGKGDKGGKKIAGSAQSKTNPESHDVERQATEKTPKVEDLYEDLTDEQVSPDGKPSDGREIGDKLSNVRHTESASPRKISHDVEIRQNEIPEDTKRFFVPFDESQQRRLVIEECRVDDVPADKLVRKSEALFRVIWRTAFAGVRLVVGPVLLFLLELARFVAHDLLDLFIVRVVAIFGDFVFKPLLTTVYNSFCLPLLTFVWNVLDTARQSIGPVLGVTAAVADQVAVILRAFRLVEIARASPAEPRYTNQVA